MDGTTIDVADTPAQRWRVRPGRDRARGWQRVPEGADRGVAPTHAVIAAVIDSYAVVEQTLAERLVTALQPGMLCLADRGFNAHPLFSAAAATGAR